MSKLTSLFVGLVSFFSFALANVANDSLALELDMSAWRYNRQDDVYYQIGVLYCATPCAPEQQTLALFVPGAFFNSVNNNDGTYSCRLNAMGVVNGFHASDAPIAFSVDTPGYMSQNPLTEYDASCKRYTNAGMIYVYAGCRGRNEGAPTGVTDLKAAIRFLRANDAALPGDSERIFTFGMSGGGAQSAVLGATGDSVLYEPYLKEIGACENASDSVFGAMCWCPITSLDSADLAYEWFLGSTRKNLVESEALLSKLLAEQYVEYVNQSALSDENGTTLLIEPGNDETAFRGSYCDYLMTVVETSLNNYLADATFPLVVEARRAPTFPPPGRAGQSGRGAKTAKPFEARDNIQRATNSNGLTIQGRFDTVDDYVAAVNQNEEWVVYDAASGRASVKSLDAFVRQWKTASKSLGAFDQLDRQQGENILFGYGDGNGAHFDATLLTLVESSDELQKAYPDLLGALRADLARKDALGVSVSARLNAYSPLYYLLPNSDGYRSSSIAPHWRIRAGIRQSDASLSTEVNLALALRAYDGVNSVDFEEIWDQFHTRAERQGDPDDNFINWACETTRKHARP